MSRQETDRLFILLRQWKSRSSIVFISHRLEEVLEVADRITVLRDGQKVATLPRDQASVDHLVSLMVARQIENRFPKIPVAAGRTVLEVMHLTTRKLQDVSLTVRQGEIVGIAGLVGSGRSSLLETIFGIYKTWPSGVLLAGHPIGHLPPHERIRVGVYLVPENRRLKGLVTSASVKENLSMVHLRETCCCGFVNFRREHAMARELVDRFDVRIRSLSQPVATLSGGNQQKVSIARWFARSGSVLLLDEPTQGVDVGAKEEIYRLMVDLARQGLGIVFVSSELPELLGMSDRIYVMRDGRITSEFERQHFSQEAILKSALGGS
ncbi:sugar ABC transporter ATP-binding protein [Carboxydochorda subterranea]|uniref:Sugar ABC transporter ATP-binding protein n=1 Tax=Carboxydichorda subterranea TaxID=3109565 RepID=A0ABZ1BWW4_9FIRM|nr:sugar ABC transporter ATP-binding protein [Limnochorda sp. L945t]WRP17304.1 sugar ABC transporter ATP-binding protein [Limnochorda sp. L945t]